MRRTTFLTEKNDMLMTLKESMPHEERRIDEMESKLGENNREEVYLYYYNYLV